MKQINLTLVICTFGLCAYCQKLRDKDIPNLVASAFTKKFPAVKSVKWEKENTNVFEAEFKLNKKETSANFDETGRWLETETVIKKSALPQAVLFAIASEFAGHEIEEVEKAETADHGIFYAIELEKDEITYDVEFSPDGKVLRKEESKDEDGDNDQ